VKTVLVDLVLMPLLLLAGGLAIPGTILFLLVFRVPQAEEASALEEALVERLYRDLAAFEGRPVKQSTKGEPDREPTT
jgi:hypothetical protein